MRQNGSNLFVVTALVLGLGLGLVGFSRDQSGGISECLPGNVKTGG